MPSADEHRSINIRPGVSILSVLKHLNYKPWFALAEFVDNSLQSYLTHKSLILTPEGQPIKRLQVEIEFEPFDGGRLIIRDNAAGISESEFPRAFRPAEVPPDRSGLSEFGMGMKSAACWFCNNWKVKTSALGDPVERTVIFDIEKIVQDSLEELEIKTSIARNWAHYTEITLTNLHMQLAGRTISKIKEHLASIYRMFLRSGELEIIYNGEKLTYNNPPILVAPPYNEQEAEAIEWRKEINFDFGTGLKATGFAALRKVASTTEAGFALFRRRRLIQGSIDDTYRPEAIFERPNSFIYQRLFGEIELEGFEVSHTKDGFRWEEDEETFLEILKEHLNEQPVPLLRQAVNYRARLSTNEVRSGAQQAINSAATVIQREMPAIVERLETNPVEEPPLTELPKTPIVSHKEITLEFQEIRWKVTLELTNEPSVSDWVSSSDNRGSNSQQTVGVREVGIRLALAHPFMERFGGATAIQIEPLLRVAVAIALSEVLARDSGVKLAGTFRRNINEILRDALSKP